MLLNEPQSSRRDDNEEIKDYLTTLVRESIGVENPAAPDPPDIPYDWITSEQIHRMSDDQRVKYCLNALRYGATRFTKEDLDANHVHPEDEGPTKLKAVAKALLVVDATLREFGVPGRLRKLDRRTLEELVREPCNLSTAREKAQAIWKDDGRTAQAPGTEENWPREGSYREEQKQDQGRSQQAAQDTLSILFELNRIAGEILISFATSIYPVTIVFFVITCGLFGLMLGGPGGIVLGILFGLVAVLCWELLFKFLQR